VVLVHSRPKRPMELFAQRQRRTPMLRVFNSPRDLRSFGTRRVYIMERSQINHPGFLSADALSSVALHSPPKLHLSPEDLGFYDRAGDASMLVRKFWIRRLPTSVGSCARTRWIDFVFLRLEICSTCPSRLSFVLCQRSCSLHCHFHCLIPLGAEYSDSELGGNRLIGSSVTSAL
jgi:hypothetical protein